MRFSLDWLRQYVSLPEPPEEVAAQLAGAGFPVDAIEAWGADHALDVDVMANRADGMCHVGLARELAARLQRPLETPPDEIPSSPAGAGAAADLAGVEIEAPDLCPRYTALVLTGVKVGPSPDWLEDRLASIGLRSVNNVVDVTNFVLHEMGQPLHAFDLDRLSGQKIIVRRAATGEKMKTLDGEERELRSDDLVIADAREPVALAGVMGGVDSEISGDTSRILIESAFFAPAAVRRTSRALGMHTDASHRFERGCDMGVTLRAARRAANLILACAGGDPASGAIDVWPGQKAPLRLALSLARTEALLGLEVPAEAACAALGRLGFDASPHGQGSPDRMDVGVPSWRTDVTREEDLIEEIARMVGYDAIPITVPGFITGESARPRPTAGLDRARVFMASAGFHEAINFPMSHPDIQRPFTSGEPGRLLVLDNPLSTQMGIMRASLLPGLLGNLAHNINRGQTDVRLFEVGRVFMDSPAAAASDREAPSLPDERPYLAAVISGRRDPAHWSASSPTADFFDLRGVLEEFASRVLGTRLELEPRDVPHLDPSAAASILVGTTAIGHAGLLRADLAQAHEIDAPVLVMEIDLRGVTPVAPDIHHVAPPRHPAAERDLALIVGDEVAYAALEEHVRAVAGEHLESVQLFDRYQGRPIPAGKVSLAVRLVFRHPDRTLTAEEVAAPLSQVVERLQAELGAVLRDAQEVR